MRMHTSPPPSLHAHARHACPVRRHPDKVHPDRKAEAEQKFRQIEEAYEVLQRKHKAEL